MLNVTDGAIDVVLIDYGFATSYLDDHGKHVKEQYVDKFLGNI